MYARLALYFLYYLPAAPTMTLKLHSWTYMIWFTLTALPFLSGKKEAFGLQNGKVVNDTSLGTLTGSHQYSQGEITLLPMYLMVSQHKVYLAVLPRVCHMISSNLLHPSAAFWNRTYLFI